MTQRNKEKLRKSKMYIPLYKRKRNIGLKIIKDLNKLRRSETYDNEF